MKVRKILLYIIIFFGALLLTNILFSNKVSAYASSLQSAMVRIIEPKNGAEFKSGDRVRIKYSIDDAYMFTYDGEIWTNPVIRIYYKGTGPIEQNIEHDLGIIPPKVTDHKRGDVLNGYLDIDLNGAGGMYIIDITCHPRTTNKNLVGKIPQSAYPSKTVIIDVYSDYDATASFANSNVSKRVGDGSFTNGFRTSSNGKVTFSSSNTKVASVNADTGEVTIKGAGTTTIKANVARSFIYKATGASYTLNVAKSSEPVKNTGTTTDTSKPTENKETQSTDINNEIKDTTTDINAVDTNTDTVSTTNTVDTANTASNNSSSTTKTKKSPTLKFANSSISKKTSNGSFTNKLTATTDGKITYSSSNTSVATVSSTGSVTIKGAGTATITAKSAETANYKAGSTSYKLTVTKASTSSSSTTTSKPSTSTSTSKPSSSTSTSKPSSSTTPSTPSTSSTPSTPSSSTTPSTSTSSGTPTTNPTVVTPSSSTSSTTTTKKTPTLKFASSSLSKYTTDSDFTNKLTFTTDGKITYKSSNTSVATIASNGKVTIKGKGTTTITATSSATTNYKSGTATYKLTVSVKDVSSSITVTSPSKKTPTLTFANGTSTKEGNVGGTITNKATSNSGGTITYKSSNTNVATVDSNGVVTFKGEGTATITATVSATTTYNSASLSYPVKGKKVTQVNPGGTGTTTLNGGSSGGSGSKITPNFSR